MSASIVSSETKTIVLQVEVSVESGNMLELEDELQRTLNEAGRLGTQELLKLFEPANSRPKTKSFRRPQNSRIEKLEALLFLTTMFPKTKKKQETSKQWASKCAKNAAHSVDWIWPALRIISAKYGEPHCQDSKPTNLS